MAVSSVAYEGDEISLRGVLTGGSYAGPEAVLLPASDGPGMHSFVIRHEVLLPNGWPVVAGDGATLILHMYLPQPEFRVDTSRPVVGQGPITLNANREEISQCLDDPEFWAGQVGSLQLECIQFEGVIRSCWGLTVERANAHYDENFTRRWRAGIWPYILFPLSGGHYVEIEYAESQTRFWIGDESRDIRVLMGYDSGHFSLPAFRFEELLALEAALCATHPAAPLLTLASVWLEPGTEAAPKFERWLGAVPGMRSKLVKQAAGVLAEMKTLSRLRWQHEEPLGWTNNWVYSQRNPNGRMTLLKPAGYQAIGEFFRRIE